MSQIAVIAKIPCKPGSRDQVVAALQPMLDHVESEDGTLVYVLHTDAKDPDLVWFYERYTDGDALGAHSTSDVMKSLGGAIGAHLAGAPELIMLTPVGGKGL